MRWLIEKLDREGKIDADALAVFKKHLAYIYKQYKEGFVDLRELVELIESSKNLKTTFAHWIADKVLDELSNFSIHDSADLNGKFAPYKEDLYIVIEEFYKELIRAI